MRREGLLWSGPCFSGDAPRDCCCQPVLRGLTWCPTCCVQSCTCSHPPPPIKSLVGPAPCAPAWPACVTPVGIQDFSAGKVSLPSVAVAQFGPMVFVNLDAAAAAATPLPKAVQEVQQRLEDNGGWEGGAVPWTALRHLRRRVYEMQCNWKVRGVAVVPPFPCWLVATWGAS
jgi:hypothetical protein